MVQAAKLPATLPLLADFFGEHPSQPANELILNADISDTATSIVSTTAIPASWPAAGRLIIDGEVIEYSSYTGSTFTVAGSGRGKETGFGAGAAAAHTAGATIGYYMTAQAFAQVLAELLQIALLARVEAVSIGAAGLTLNWALGSTKIVTRTGTPTSLTLSNPVNGMTYRIVLLPAAFDWPSWPAAVQWGTAGAPTLTQNKGHVIDLTFNSTDSEYYAVYVTDFS